jgi:hypothetical protein
MKVILSTREIVVVDDFLAASAFRLVLEAVEREPFSFINAVSWDRVYQLSDGRPLESPMYVFPPAVASRVRIATPHSKGLVTLAQTVLERAAVLASWLKKRSSFQLVTLRCQLFPKDTMLDWHNDSRARVATYTYYAHPEWRERWGGELLIANTREARKAAEPRLVTGIYVPPRPNRLVLLKAGIPHMIKRIEHSAGDAIRVAVAGSLVRSAVALMRYRRGAEE